jgi:hypothetical protein
MYDSPPFVTTGDESSDPEVIQHIKPENRTAKERQILDDALRNSPAPAPTEGRDPCDSRHASSAL